MIKRIVVSFFMILVLASCASRKKIEYFQNVASISGSENARFEPRLQPDDLLMIIVSAPDSEAAIPFNLPTVGVVGTGTGEAATAQQRFQTYLIDNNGNIQFPILGAVKLAGLTRTEALSKLIDDLKKYINNPIVNIRIMNYKVSVMGEVVRPGSMSIPTERITLPEAISMAGDMTIYGSREDILIIREADGQKTYNFVDMTKADFVNSPFYYLTQNDLVYIKPNKTRVNSSVIGPNITVGISAISLLITIIALSSK